MVVSLAVVAALVVVALLVASTDVGRDLLDPDRSSTDDGTGEATLVALVGAHAFDPLGDGQRIENDALAGAAVDGDPATTWRTETYSTRDFGRLKDGVGLVIDLGTDTAVGRVAVTSPTTGWSLELHVAGADGAQLDGWGPAVASTDRVVDGGATLDADGARGRYLLLWITDLGDGPDHRVEISEVLVAS